MQQSPIHEYLTYRVDFVPSDEPLGAWLARVVGLLRAADSSEDAGWTEIESFLVAFSSALGAGAVGRSEADELLELAELADLTDICGQGNRAPRHARDLIGRFYRKSIESGSFFRDVRMTPTLFDEVVALTALHLPRGRRGPHALPPA